MLLPDRKKFMKDKDKALTGLVPKMYVTER